MAFARYIVRAIVVGDPPFAYGTVLIGFRYFFDLNVGVCVCVGERVALTWYTCRGVLL